MRTVTQINADLDAAYASRLTALQAQSYSLDTGQGKQSVQRADLNSINKLIRELQNELETATDDANGGSGIISGNFQRY